MRPGKGCRVEYAIDFSYRGKPSPSSKNVLLAGISYRLWQQYFRRDPSILGRAVRINWREVNIVGVEPPEFHGDFAGVALDGWIRVPLTGKRQRDARNFQVIVRLKLGPRSPRPAVG